MREQRESTTESQAPASSGILTRDNWSHGLLIAAVVVYGAGAALLMATPIPAIAGGWLAGTVAVLVAMGILASAVRLPGRVLIAPRQHHQDEDPWAEVWEELMQRPVR
ncbi:MAG: hypothetical protein HW388_1074 [Dehalococcoidia bacterium]|nr:hypothetical protein [Dehalococcoidia bacterium]